MSQHLLLLLLLLLLLSLLLLPLLVLHLPLLPPLQLLQPPPPPPPPPTLPPQLPPPLPTLPVRRQGRHSHDWRYLRRPDPRRPRLLRKATPTLPFSAALYISGKEDVEDD